jgi:glutamate transport system permease protein
VAPIGNIFVALIKNTSLALTISVMELGFQYDRLLTTTAQAVPVSVGIVVCYLALALSAGWLFSVLEHRVAMKR